MFDTMENTCTSRWQLGIAASAQAGQRPGAVPPRRAAAAGHRQGRRQPALIAAAPAASSSTVSAGILVSSEPELVKRWGGRHKLLPVRPELAAELRPLAALAGVADASKLSRAVAAVGPTREAGVIKYGPAVAQLLLSLGMQRPQLAELLHRCPLLFSRPADERAALLFEQLARLGLTAPEAARCFQQQPIAAGMPSFEQGVAVVAPLFAAGSKAGSGKSGEQLLGDFLRRQPAAVGLLSVQQKLVQQRLSNLVQRYGPHWVAGSRPLTNKHAVIIGALRQCDGMLARSPEHWLALEAVLQREVGQQPGDGTRLVAHMLQHRARAASGRLEPLGQRARALVAEFGRESLLLAAPQPVASALAATTNQWQRAMAVWRRLGAADPAAVGRRNLALLGLDWLDPARLAAVVALQRLLPWRPSAADVLQQLAVYTSRSSVLIGRLLFLQQEGLLPLLVADKWAARRQWQQRRLRAGQPADEPQFIGLRDVAILSDAKFCSVLATSQPEQPGSCSSRSGASSVAERYEAFMARLPQLPAYQQLLAAGEAESQRLTALLPPELAAAAAAAAASKQSKGRRRAVL